MSKFEKGLAAVMVALFIIFVVCVSLVIRNFSVEAVGETARQIQQEFNKGYDQQAKDKHN